MTTPTVATSVRCCFVSVSGAIPHCQSRDALGTFWAHLVSIEVNSGESHSMSFRSSVPIRLRDQHPETGSIPGSSTESNSRSGT